MDKTKPVTLDDETARDLQALGYQGTELETEEETFEVLPQNWKSVKAFITLRTQWRSVVGANGIYTTGLDYTAVVAVFKDSSKGFRKLLDDLQIMEEAALPILNEGD